MPEIKEINTMLKLKLLIYLFFAVISVSCQKKEKNNLFKIATLSTSLNEVSGITMISGSNHIYAINDSGNSNEVFCLNQQGVIEQIYKVPQSKNKDWEDITYDHNGTIYIGDFGNNVNDRKELVIYTLSGVLSDVVKTQKTTFSFEDQKKFPPKKKNRNFDVEAFIYRNESFYLFTKNRSSEFDGTTKVYKIKAKPGQQIAKLIDTFKTCNDPNDCFITAAAINQKGNKIALLTYNKVYLLSDFKGDRIFSGNIQKIKLNHYSQKEGICFKNDTTLLITDEKRGLTGSSNLYEYFLQNKSMN